MSSAALLLRALVTRYARSHALRSIVTLVAVALGVASAYAIDLANGTAIASFTSSVNVIANRVNLQVFGTGVGFDERTLLRVQALPGVRVASPVVTGELVVGSRGALLDGEIVRVLGIDITRASAPPGVRDAQAGAAQFDLHRFIDDDGIFISERIARSYHAPAGGTLRAFAGARPVRLPVMGVIPPHTVGVDSSVAFVDIATAQQLFHEVGRLDRIDIEADPAHLDAVRAAVERVVPHGTRVLAPRTRLSEIRRMLASFTMNLTALAYVALLVGMYLIYNAVAISVVQRSAEIGTLRALGARRAQIFRTFVTEGALYGALGSVAGLLLGFLLARFSLGAVQQTVSALYVGSHSDAVVFSWFATIKAFALGVLLAMAAAALPAANAAATPAARIMRNTGAAERRVRGFTRTTALAGVVALILAVLAMRLPAIGDGIPLFGYVAGVLAIAGVSLLTPSALAFATLPLGVLRNAYATIAAAFLRASPRRISVAVASLTVAVAMMVAIAVLVGSFRATIVAWTNDTLSADLYITTPGAADADLRGGFTQPFVDRIARVPGVRAVDTIRRVEIVLDGKFADLGATDVASLVSRNKLRFLGNVDVAHLAAAMHGTDTVVVSVPFSTHFHLGVGDSFVLNTPAGNVPVRILAVYNDYSTSGGTLFMDDSTFRRLYHDATYDSVAAYLAPGADVGRVRTAIERAVAPLKIDINTNDELRAYALGVFDRTFAITNALYIVSIVIAVLGVVSTLFALVLERRIDIALLRYIGLTRTGVQRMVFVQALAIGTLSGVLGILLGLILAADLIFVINRQSFGWLIEWHSPGWFYLQAFAMVVVAAIVAAVYPAVVASRVHSSEVMRVE
ncbi:MAG: FtsX-like permease family protein [bacterium]|nr:FtsX-like permease family protein [bacterium]